MNRAGRAIRFIGHSYAELVNIARMHDKSSSFHPPYSSCELILTTLQDFPVRKSCFVEIRRGPPTAGIIMILLVIAIHNAPRRTIAVFRAVER